jgi:hypothetical protein
MKIRLTASLLLMALIASQLLATRHFTFSEGARLLMRLRSSVSRKFSGLSGECEMRSAEGAGSRATRRPAMRREMVPRWYISEPNVPLFLPLRSSCFATEVERLHAGLEPLRR